MKILTRNVKTERLVVVLLLLLGALSSPRAFGVPTQVGVKAGDWAHYSIGQDPTGNTTLVKSLMNQFSAYNNTRYASVNFTTVYGTIVNLTQGIHYMNGTTLASSLTVDVSQGVDPTNPPIVIMQNYQSLGNGLTNGTFFGVQRIINSLYVSPSQGNASRYTWDETTGVLISKQILYTVDAANGSTGTFTFTFSMTSTNLWYYVPSKNPSGRPPPMPLDLQFAELYALAGVAGSITVGILAVRRNRRSKIRQRSKNGLR